MELQKQNELIIVHWTRLLFAHQFIVHLIPLIVKFCQQPDEFDRNMTDKDLAIDNAGMSVRCIGTCSRGASWKSAVGSFIATPNGKYKWSMHLSVLKTSVCVGVIQNAYCGQANGLKRYWWSGGAKAHGTIIYAFSYAGPGDDLQRDSFEMVLDLKECTLVISRQDVIVCESDNIARDTEYRLAVGMYGSFEPTQVDIVDLQVLKHAHST